VNTVKQVKRPVALLLGVVSASSAVSDQFGLAEIAVAYYEVAPRSLSASMRLAVEWECAGVELEEYPWLCGDRALYFVRGVDQWGKKRNTGFVCKGDPDRKYFPVNMFEEHSDCLPVRYDDERKRHYLWR
jgi:hypothetical protein